MRETTAVEGARSISISEYGEFKRSESDVTSKGILNRSGGRSAPQNDP